MAMPRRIDVEDFLAQLPRVARPHLDELRALSLAADPRIEETLHWNQPAYVIDGVRQWLLQAWKAHASLRFPTRMFAAHAAAVAAAGYEAGEGFVKLPYDRPIPAELCAGLMQARIAEFDATGAKWTDD